MTSPGFLVCGLHPGLRPRYQGQSGKDRLFVEWRIRRSYPRPRMCTTIPDEASIRKLIVSPLKDDQQRALLFVRKLPSRSALELLLLCLRTSKLEFVRATAAVTLGQVKFSTEEESVSAMRELFVLLHSDTDYGVRSSAATGLGYYGESYPNRSGEIIDVLTRALMEDTDWQVHFSALAAIGEVRDKRTIPTVLRYLQNDNPLMVQAAVGALGNIGEPATVPSLLEMLGSNDMMTRQRLAHALGQIKEASREPAVLDALRTLARDQSIAVREAANDALTRAGCADPARKSELSEADLLQREVNSLLAGDEAGHAPETAGDALRRRLERSFDKECADGGSEEIPSTKTSGIENDSDGMLTVEEFANAIEDLKCDDVGKQTMALISLRRGDAQQVREAVLDIGLLDPERAPMRVRSLAVRLVARTKDIGTVLNSLANDPEENVRSACCDAAAEAGGGPQAINACVEAFRNDRHWLVRISAAIALGSIGKGCEITEDALINALKPNGVVGLDETQSSVVRRHAIIALGFLGSEKSLDIFETLIQGDNTEQPVRLRIANALRGIRCLESVRLLKQLIETDPNEEVAEMAQGSLDTLTQLGFA